MFMNHTRITSNMLGSLMFQVVNCTYSKVICFTLIN